MSLQLNPSTAVPHHDSRQKSSGDGKITMQTAEGGDATVHCAACANAVRASAPLQQHQASHNSQTYTLQRCPICDLQFWWPLKADPSVYEGEGFEAYVDYHSGTRPFPRWAEPLFRSLPTPAGTALDIGCGDGAVLDRLAKAGFEVNGIDLDEKSIRVAKEKYGLKNVAAITLENYATSCRESDVHFDLITFFEVLEHQDAPREFLAEVAALGKSGGLVAGSVPNRDRFLARLDRRLSAGDFPPHHFLWFSASSLKRLLEKEGYRDVFVSFAGALTYGDIVGKLRNIITRKTRAWPSSMRILVPLMKGGAILAAVIPWLGMRMAPSHLFFRCRIP